MSALVIISAFAATAPSPAPAATTMASAEPNQGVSTYVDLEAGAGYSTNPLLQFGSDTGAAFGRVSAHAVHTRLSARTTTVLSAFGQNSFYTNGFGAQQSVDLNARHDARVSEHLRVFGDVDFAYDKGGQLDTRIIGVPNVPLPPGTIQPPVLLPPGSDFLSVTGRSYRMSGHLGAQVALSARDYLTVTSGVEHSVFKGVGLDTRYTTIPVSFGYDRQISARTTVGGRLVAQYTDYDGPGNVRVITPQLTMSTALSERMSFNGAVGVSFAATDDGVRTHHTTGLAANASLCSAGERDSFCARAAVDQQAATVIGSSRNVSVGLDYSRRLDANQTLRFALDANRYSAPISVITGQTFAHTSYVRGAADYTRRLSDRWFGGASLAARKIAQSGPDPKADVSGSLFIRYRLGDVR
jgi:hypothetical protein